MPSAREKLDEKFSRLEVVSAETLVTTQENQSTTAENQQQNTIIGQGELAVEQRQLVAMFASAKEKQAKQRFSFELPVLLSFAAIYVIWGSTYLAIRMALTDFPPFVMAGIRFIVAGSIMYLWLRARGVEAPTRIHWRSAAIVGALLLIGGNGSVVWAEQSVPSGLVSLLVSVVPIWIALVDWVRPGGKAPTPTVIAGLIIGLAGVALLVGPTGLNGNGMFGAILLMLGSLSWSIGSLVARHAELPKNAIMATAIEMLCGGVFMLVIGGISGEFAHFHASSVSLPSLLALLYLIVFGSIVGFSAYIFLLGKVSPAQVATYAYVNPVVAVLLGWLFAGETFGIRTIFAAATILAAVALITNQQRKSKDVEQQQELEDECSGPAAGAAIHATHAEGR